MANSQQDNVIFCDTTALTVSGPKRIAAVKYIGNASGTAAILSGVTAGSGGPIWQEAGTANLSVDPINVYAKEGFNVVLANGAKVYIYLEA